jgi:4-hydroxy-3-methylbut-2-en-1-yl diphosphate reductase
VVERVVLVAPRGFCAGVTRAVAMVEWALRNVPQPVYVRRPIVHNRSVLARLKAAGARFVDELEAVPIGASVIFSAHGVAPSIWHQAEARRLRVLDATCPLVRKVHREVRRFSAEGRDVILIGHAGHDEVAGTMGQASGVRLVEDADDAARVRVTDPGRVACVTQTTLSQADVLPITDCLRRRFPAMVTPAASDICYATRNRQAAVRWLARFVDLVVIVGDRTSSNSVRLVEAARAEGTHARLIVTADELRHEWIDTFKAVGVSAGASTPDSDIANVVSRLCQDGARLEPLTLTREDVSFVLAPGKRQYPRP